MIGLKKLDISVQAAGTETLNMGQGLHLFLDDYWLGQSTNVTRFINKPARTLTSPVLDSARFGVVQPFITVLPKDGGGYRMWFVSTPDITPTPTYWGPNMEIADSADGQNWDPASQRRLTNFPATYANTIMDSKAAGSGQRFKTSYQQHDRQRTAGVDFLKTRLATSADGVNWTDSGINTLFPGHGVDGTNNWGDIVDFFYDPATAKYTLFFRYSGPYSWTDAEGVKHTNVAIRRTGQVTSTDFLHWTDTTNPKIAFAPDQNDSGITQFYGGAVAVERKGDLLVGFLKVLRDDLSATGAIENTTSGTPPTSCITGRESLGGCGIGYSVLTWSRDNGQTWTRDREAFLSPNPTVGSWDHAHAWISSTVPIGNVLNIYYGGYKWGHKWSSATDRQIGLVKITKDRYVARKFGATAGKLLTKPIVLAGNQLILNADFERGSMTIKALDLQGNTLVTCPVYSQTDKIDYALVCNLPTNTPIQLEFSGTNGYLFGIEVKSNGAPTLTPTPTRSVTATPSPTRIPTATLTPTKTPTPTQLPTATPTPVQTETPTPGGCNKSADLDKSGLVDLSDASQLIVDLGQTGNNLVSDLNCDGLVDLSDFSILINKFGQS